MQRVEKELPRDHEIMLMGCTHEDVMMYEEGLNKHIMYIAEDRRHRFWAHLGDWIEAIPTDDKRYRYIQRAVPIPRKQAEAIKNRFSPISQQGIVGLEGNHERRHHRITNLVEDDICKPLNIPYGTGTCRVIIKDTKGRPMYNMLLTHGYWNFISNAKDYEQQQANMKAMLRLKLNNLRMGDCAIQACAHAHKILISPPANPLYLTDRPKGVKQHYLEMDPSSTYIPPEQRWCACVGSYRKNMVDGIHDYAELYGPVELGCVKLVVRDGIPKMEAMIV